LLQTELAEQGEKKVAVEVTVTENGAYENKGADIEMSEIKIKVDGAEVETKARGPLHVDTRTRAEKERPDEPADEPVSVTIHIIDSLDSR